MSEEDLEKLQDTDLGADLLDAEKSTESEIIDFDQNGRLLKIATDGISVLDYVKRMKESDILVAVDGEIYLDGPQNLINKFNMEEGDEAKWLLTFWRDGEVFDILLTSPIQSKFGLATEEETTWALDQFKTHIFGDFESYQNFEIFRDKNSVCDILSMEKDPLAAFLPLLWCLKFRLFPPFAALAAAYLVTFFINIYLFIITYLVLSRFFSVSQQNILRSFSVFAGKSHYMTIASTNENDVSAIIKKIDIKNKIRFEANAIKKPTVIHKVIVNNSSVAEK